MIGLIIIGENFVVNWLQLYMTLKTVFSLFYTTTKTQQNIAMLVSNSKFET